MSVRTALVSHLSIYSTVFSLTVLAACSPDKPDSETHDSSSQPGPLDADNDGYAATEDCDDTNAAINPGATEICNELDDNCDSVIDTDATVTTPYYLDADADGYGLADTTVSACSVPEGYAALTGDCDDTNADYHPGADESDCTDPNDYNCDGSVGYADADGDGFAACSECDDNDAAINSAAIEACDGVDNNCDGSIDEAGAFGETTWLLDADGDGFGDASASVVSCSAPEGYVADSSDCDDTLDTFHPGADESDCTDPSDYNCDGSVGYADADGDGTAACEDCDDANAGAYPGGIEVCDGADNDCDTIIDVAAVNTTVFYADLDGDSYGDADVYADACEAPSGFVSDASDCDDAAASTFPGASETCDGVDNDCDDAIDDGLSGAWYLDADGDGYGDPEVGESTCGAPSGYVADATDCDDADYAVHPDASDSCDGVDTDCNGVVDNNTAPTAPVVSIAPASPRTDDALTAQLDTAAYDADGDTVTYSYHWTRDGVSSETDASIAASATTSGQAWRVQVSANDGCAAGPAGTDSVTIANTAPTLASTGLAPDPAYENDVLTCTAGATADADGDAVGLSYEWVVNGAALGFDSVSLESSSFDRGDSVYCTATPTDGADDGMARNSNTLTVSNSTPSIAGVSISPTSPRASSTLTCSYSGFADIDGDADQSTYAWTVDGVLVGTAATLSGAFVGSDVVTCTVTPEDGTDSGTAASSIVTLANTAPVLASVSLMPTAATESSTLTCAPGPTTDADGTSSFTYSYAWTVNSVGIAPTTSTLTGTYFAAADAVACFVTANDGTSSSAAVTSNSVTIANTAPVMSTVSVSPATGRVGDVLTCAGSAIDVDGGTPSMSYAWSTGATGASLTLTSAHNPGDVLTCTATATDSAGAADSDTASATVTNTAPVVSTVSVTPDTGTVGDVLTCAGSATDEDGGSPTMSYAWSTGATGASLMLTASDNPGDVLTCTATASDADGGTAAGSASATVLNTAPVMGTVSISPATAYNDDLLTCSASSTDADGGTPSLTYAWTNTSTATSIGSGATLSLSSARAASRQTIACAVAATDANGGTATGSTSLMLGNRAPVATVSLTPASPTRTSTLTCTGSATDADADSTSLSFGWTVGGSAVSATSSSSTSSTLAGAFMAGQLVVCTVTASDGKSGTHTDTGSVSIGNTAPVVSSVTLSPSTVYTNDTLTANVVSSDADGDALSLSYAWYVGGTLVPAATSSSLSGASYFDKGHAVYVTATANDGTTSTALTSSSITVSNTAPSAPVVEITPVDAESGDDLTCSVTTAATDADGDALTYSFVWDIDGVDYASATDLATYSVVDGADVGGGETWTCEVVAGDGTETSGGASDATTTASCGDQSFADEVRALGAIAYWDLDETSGSFVDSISGYIGTLSGSASRGVTGLLDGGLAVDFSGAGSIVVPYVTALNTTTQTVVFWVRPDGGSGFRSPFTNRLNPFYGTGLYVDPSASYTFYYGDGSAWRGPSTPIAPAVVGTPAMLGYVLSTSGSSSTMTAYVDGVTVGDGTSGRMAANPYVPLRIGSGVSEYYFDGVIDGVAIFNTALTSSEMTDLYAAGDCP